jgi:hypothetical protein
MPQAYPSIDPQSAADNIYAFRQQALQFKQQQVESQLLGALLNAEPEKRNSILAESMKEEKPSLLNNLLQIPTKQQLLASSPTVRSLMGQMMGVENPDNPYVGFSDEEKKHSRRIAAGLEPKATNREDEERYSSTPWYLSPQWKDTEQGKAAQASAGRSNNLPKAYEPNDEEKAYESDMKTMNNKNTPQAIKRTARQRLSQNPLLNAEAPEKDFSKLMSEMPETKRTDAPWYSPFTFDDDVYGDEAYDKALDTAIIEGAAKGYSVNSVKKRFDEFWDSKYKAEKGQRYQKYTQRPQDLTSPRRAKKQDKSPYEEYPDAFLEEGIWKVKIKGKKYRIQED